MAAQGWAGCTAVGRCAGSGRSIDWTSVFRPPLYISGQAAIGPLTAALRRGLCSYQFAIHHARSMN
jgi:hypothetical protein